MRFNYDAFFYSALAELERYLSGRSIPQKTAPPVKITKAFRTLEISYTRDLHKIRQGYRRMIRHYHPDRYAKDQRKQQIATELASHLSEAYQTLMQYFQKSPPPSG